MAQSPLLTRFRPSGSDVPKSGMLPTFFPRSGVTDAPDGMQRAYGGPARGALNTVLNMPITGLDKPFTTTPKSPAMTPRISRAGGNFDQNQAANNLSLTEFTRQLLGTSGQQMGNAEQEGDAINKFYTTGKGSVKADLDQMARESAAAGSSALQEAIKQVTRQANHQRMNFGNNSGIDRSMASVVGRLAIEQANKNADLARNNYLYRLEGQRVNQGRRNQLIMDALNSLLAPVQARQAVQGNDMNQLSSLLNLENANTLYETPEQQVQRRLSLADSLAALNDAQDFYR